MASAMSSLKKMKKNPLPSTVPFRNAATTNPGVSDENQLLEEVTSLMAATRLKDLHTQSVINVGQKPTSRRTSMDTRNVPSDHELMILMTNRIKSLETRVQFQSQELTDKDKKIKILEDKVNILKKSRVEGSPEKLNQLERKCLLLQQQVYEMEGFLSDYGMIWVGDKTNPDSDVYLDEDADASDSEGRVEVPGLLDPKFPGVWKPAESVASEFSVDYDLFARNINELNAVAGDGIAKIHHTADGARLKMPDPVQLTLYSNGLLMFNGPFRPLSDPLTRDLVKDIMDGYFPSELQARFPEGVPFKFTDKRNVIFKDKRSEVFQGEGQILGGETNRSRLVPSSASKDSKSRRSGDAPVETEIPGRKLTMEQFLNKIPKSVVKNGKVIDIRNSLQEKITGNDGKTGPGIVTVVDTPQLRELKGRLELDESERPPSSRQITTLRIKSELGDRTYILKMRFTDTIGDLRKYLNKERGASKTSYKIMSAFPKTVFDDDQATLQQCGLTPNAALHLLATN